MTEGVRDQLSASRVSEVLAGLWDTCVWQEHIYKDIHANPELSFQETKTAALEASVCVKRRTARHYFT
jgi:metal-dependent amidase/aminoacylase/carboxypeptidase family protein